MKLYATTTSDRASKGQGGNEFINIHLTVGDQNAPTDVYDFECQGDVLNIYHNNEHEMTIHHKKQIDCGCEQGVYACLKHSKEKGNKQKGEPYKGSVREADDEAFDLAQNG